LFSEQLAEAYASFASSCFETYGEWGSDALLKTGFARRREVFGSDWNPSWEAMFAARDGEGVSEAEIAHIKALYNDVLAQLVAEIKLTESRSSYASAREVSGAY
jgi:hypothetical protein